MKNILITGLPGVGKTSLIKKIYEIFKEFNPAGFYTEEILEGGMRQGFAIVNFNGDSSVLAHVSLKSKYFVGKYKIDMKGFEGALEKIFSKDRKSGLYIIDEIGKVECKSRKFNKLVVELFNSEKPVVATVAERGADLIDAVKKRDDTILFEVNLTNRELKLKELTITIRDILMQ